MQPEQEVAGESKFTGKPIRVMIANATADMGGAEQVALTLAERLPAQGIEVSFALLRPGPLQQTLESRGIRVHVFPEDYRFRDIGSILRCIKWLTACIRADGANILHSNLTAHFIGGWAARRAGIPELWHLHDYNHNFDPVHEISRRMPVDFCVFTTDYLKGGEPLLHRRPNAVVHPDCVDVVKLSRTPGDPEVRDRLAIGSGPYFLTVTRLQEHKGHTYLIEAAAKVAAAHPKVRWVIAGQAKGAEQETYAAKLRAQVAALGLENKIIFPGFVRDEDLVPLYREAYALVHPALTEGYGLVLLEAMACGLPVIAAAATGPAEIIENDRNGLLAPVADAAGLAKAMLRLLDEPAVAVRLRDQASQDVLERSVEQMVDRTVKIYRQMLAH